MRIQITRSKNAECFYVIKSIYENGIHTTKVVEKLGNLEQVKAKAGSEDPYEWAKRYAAELTEQDKKEHHEIVLRFQPCQQMEKDIRNCYNGGYLFLKKIYYELGLDRICRKIGKNYKYEYDLNEILETLVYARILSPSSKQGTAEYAEKMLEKPAFQLHDVYRSLEVLAKENDLIQSELYRNSKELGKRNDRILYYDCTNYYFEMEDANGLCQYGYSKEHRPNPIVEMGLFMDGDGIPLAFCIHSGNTNEQATLKPLEKQVIKDFEHAEFVVCTDAGLSSYDNRKFNSIQNRKFITVQSVRVMKKLYQKWIFNPGGWHLPNERRTYNLDEIRKEPEKYADAVFFKERWINEQNLEQRYIVTFSLKYEAYLKALREKHLVRAEEALKNPGSLDKKRNTDYRRFIGMLPVTDEGEIASGYAYYLDEERMLEEEKYDGYYAVATNLEDDVQTVLNANSRRWQIEECFRIMKSEFRARPVYLSRDDRIRAHFLTCFLALTVYRYLEKRIGCKYTCREILSTLKEMNFARIRGEGFMPVYTRTEITDALHESFGFRTDYTLIEKAAMRKIISSLKKKA
jgi:transposase